MDKLKVLLVSILFAGAFSSIASSNDERGCERVYNSDAKINCIKLNKVNRKLNRVLRYLERGEVDYSGNIIRREFTCKARIHGNRYFEGYGRNAEEAQENFYQNCSKAYSKYTCGRSGVQCEYKEVERSTHFACEIYHLSGQNVFKGVGRTKNEALTQTINLCLNTWKEKTCFQRIKQCYEY